MELDPATIRAAAARLRGQLVATPLIGGLSLPGFDSPADLRIKPENLQPTGSIWFRGALHFLARTLGSLKGLAVVGDTRPVLAAAAAAHLQRLETSVILTAEQNDADLRAMISATGASVSVVVNADAAHSAAERLRGEGGVLVMPGLEATDYAAGIATVGLELAAELPADVDAVIVSPGVLAIPIQRGLDAGGRNVQVSGLDATDADVDDLRHALEIGARIACDPTALPALAVALQGQHGNRVAVVLSA